MIDRSSVRSGAPSCAATPAHEHEHARKTPTAGPPPLVWQLTADQLDWPSLRALLGTSRNTRLGMLQAPPSQWRRAAQDFMPRAMHRPAAFACFDSIARMCLRYEIAQRNIEANTPVAHHDEVFDDATFDVNTWSPADQLAVTAHAWSPDGSLLALGSRDGNVRILDAAGASVLNTAHGSKVLELAWSPDGRRCASGAIDGTVHILDTQTSQVANVRHEGQIIDLYWSPNSIYLVAPNSGHCLTIFNAQENRATGSVVERDSITSAAWSPDSTLVTVGCADGTVRLCRADNAAILASHRHLIHGVARVWIDPVLHSEWSSDGTMVLNVGAEKTLSLMTANGDIQPVSKDLLARDVTVPWMPEINLENGRMYWAPDGTSVMTCTKSKDPLHGGRTTVTVQRFAPTEEK